MLNLDLSNYVMYNYISKENNTKIFYFSSQTRFYFASNILKPNPEVSPKKI